MAHIRVRIRVNEPGWSGRINCLGVGCTTLESIRRSLPGVKAVLIQLLDRRCRRIVGGVRWIVDDVCLWRACRYFWVVGGWGWVSLVYFVIPFNLLWLLGNSKINWVVVLGEIKFSYNIFRLFIRFFIQNNFSYKYYYIHYGLFNFYLFVYSNARANFFG